MLNTNKTTYVTKTFLPPKHEYIQYLDRIWETAIVTNEGPLVIEFENKIKHLLDVNYVHFVTNGTIALQLALDALNIKSGEIITTPFSYVATTSSILWERCTPVFVDIEDKSFCIDTSLIEQAITNKTRAIMGVHVFGNPCDVDAINKIAQKYNIKVLYDGAHAFNVKLNNKSIFSFGDIVTGSFHATKMFHTIEGGCIVTQSEEINHKLKFNKKFGHDSKGHIMLGINGKSSEFNAAMGLCNLKYLDEIIERRRLLSEAYDNELDQSFFKPSRSENVEYNYAYYAILFKDEHSLLRAFSELNENNIFPRRYFYPSLNTLHYLADRTKCPISENIASRIACLPLFHDLDINTIKKISIILNKYA